MRNGQGFVHEGWRFRTHARARVHRAHAHTTPGGAFPRACESGQLGYQPLYIFILFNLTITGEHARTCYAWEPNHLLTVGRS